MKKIYFIKNIKNKKGGLSLPMVPLVLAFIASVIMCVEYFIMVSSMNDIQYIMDSVANGALRAGIKHDYHKDENIIGTTGTNNTIDINSVDIAKIRETYSNLLWENLDRSIAKHSLEDANGNIRTNFKLLTEDGTDANNRIIYKEDTSFLTNPRGSKSPVIRLEKTKWSNTHSSSDIVLDTIILDAVAEIRLKTSNMIPSRIIEYTFTRKEHNSSQESNAPASTNTTFTAIVENDSTNTGYTKLIVRSSTRMILK